MGLKSKAAKLKAGKSKEAKSKDAKAGFTDMPATEVVAADETAGAEWVERPQSADQARKAAQDGQSGQAMSAPSLENAIITKARDLSRLSREDLLQLLLTQSKDAERLQDYLREVADEFERYTNLNARLREKLDAKDEQIERLKRRLDDKDQRIAQMKPRLEELEAWKKEEDRRSRIIVSAAEGVRGALEAFNVTTDWYVASLQEVCGDLGGKQPAHLGSAPSHSGNAPAHAAPAGGVSAQVHTAPAGGVSAQVHTAPTAEVDESLRRSDAPTDAATADRSLQPADSPADAAKSATVKAADE